MRSETTETKINLANGFNRDNLESIYSSIGFFSLVSYFSCTFDNKNQFGLEFILIY